ncbi:uncharacterized protein CC84DRAFT_863381 [Paraphaeosphaeria sporulosa]|uniref:Uncharacterized protein n=1 Tax=Paraphaeosphaeria sporulosa TaxID=1460663 RepID=A0A177C811_9PLEO|nr:uncharacterized protein CC84DRAFT_863381 [Paraphaeosphaeria sporulosa]OAG03695.1 hypothetical protein CC84DRAFT_863381 [Paraphaeosphaeria sporulosa]
MKRACACHLVGHPVRTLASVSPGACTLSDGLWLRWTQAIPSRILSGGSAASSLLRRHEGIIQTAFPPGLDVISQASCIALGVLRSLFFHSVVLLSRASSRKGSSSSIRSIVLSARYSIHSLFLYPTFHIKIHI